MITELELIELYQKALIEVQQRITVNPAFRVGFNDGFDKGYRLAEARAEKREAAYASFLRGQITQQQLDEALSS